MAATLRSSFIGPKLNDAEQYARLTPYSTIRTTNKLAANAASFAMAVFSRPPGRLRIKLNKPLSRSWRTRINASKSILDVRHHKLGAAGCLCFLLGDCR